MDQRSAISVKEASGENRLNFAKELRWTSLSEVPHQKETRVSARSCVGGPI